VEDGETPRIRKYGESKTARIMMATVLHVTAWARVTKYQSDGFLFDGVYQGGSWQVPCTFFNSCSQHCAAYWLLCFWRHCRVPVV